MEREREREGGIVCMCVYKNALEYREVFFNKCKELYTDGEPKSECTYVKMKQC
jgi:hypothetical protein